MKPIASLVLLVTSLVSAHCAPAIAGSPPSNDYSNAENWLCRPGRHDACDIDLDSMIVRAGGAMQRETFHAAKNAAVDCFYFAGDVFTHGNVRPRWGLHVVDVELTMGNLLDLVDAQSKSWRSAQHLSKH